MDKREAKRIAWVIVGHFAYQESMSPTDLTLSRAKDYKEVEAIMGALFEIYDQLFARYNDRLGGS